MRKKIIFFLPNFSQGGAAESIVKILIDFSNKNIDCELICLNKCFYKKILIKNSVKVTEIKCNKAIYAILKIKDYLKKLSNNYKIYFVSNINYANVLSLLFFRNIKDIKIIIVERTPVQELDYNYGSLIKFIKNYLLKALIKILYAKSDLRIGNSKKVSKDFFQFTKSKFFTIYPQSIKAISKKNIFFKATNNKIKIIWVGRLDREKSFETLINALNYNFGKKIEVSVLGPGNKDFLKKKIILNKNINYKFYGYKKNLQKFFLRSDIYINTSLYEGFPNAVIQAMNYGLPVITSRSDGGILEITNNGKYATLFATKQHIELRKILIDYSLNREHYQKKACAAKINLRKFKFNNVLNAYQKKILSL